MEKLTNPQYLEIAILVIIAALSAYAFYWTKRKETFSFLEQSFDDLQRMNEKFLESPENLWAAIMSARPDDDVSKEDARMMYIQYMRINRIFRTWSYGEKNFISKKSANSVIRDHIGVLKNIEDRLPAMLERGYPNEFRGFLLNELKSARPVAKLGGIGKPINPVQQCWH